MNRNLNLTEGFLLMFAAICFSLSLGYWLFDDDDAPTGDIGTALTISRELRCEEDEEIIVALGGNGLPYGFCQQVIDR